MTCATTGTVAPSGAWVDAVRDDPHFAPLWERTRSVTAVEAAGFFHDGLDDPAGRRDHGEFALPANRLDPRGGVVLVATGGFGPLHDGHVTMLEHARAAVERTGRRVAGGYICCDHDTYMGAKQLGQLWPAERRVATAAVKLADHPWLTVDPWPALWAPTALNFTDICAHVQTQLDATAPGRYEVWFTFGSDNAGFSEAFRSVGHAVCVPRPGYPPPTSCDRVLVAEEGIAACSTALRITEPAPATNDAVYVLRDDLEWGAATLGLAPSALSGFRSRLVELLTDSVGAPVRVVDVAATSSVAAAVTSAPVVSLDLLTPAAATLSLSRRFHLDGIQAKAHSTGARPGAEPLAAQLEEIQVAVPGGRCVLIDDDISTGATVAAATRLLNDAGIDVIDVVAVIDEVVAPHRVRDVVDARDFLVGARDAGLVVEGPADVMRAPYLAPYVNLHTRASAAPGMQLELSAALWELNGDVHGGAGTRVGDLPAGTATLFEQFGWSPQSKVAEMCFDHAARIHARVSRGRRGNHVASRPLATR